MAWPAIIEVCLTHQPAKRATALDETTGAFNSDSEDLSPAPRADIALGIRSPGLTTRALCRRALRALSRSSNSTTNKLKQFLEARVAP